MDTEQHRVFSIFFSSGRAHIAVPMASIGTKITIVHLKAVDAFLKSRHIVAGQAMCASCRAWDERNNYLCYVHNKTSIYA